ncbi:RIP metalloprotease RseP [Helicobacter pametensis]|uniref:RIP metalloprotease RseP n=1 Tax=Helicobacter pametensis TaxID=95149 RepID=UPI000481CAAF|nr:RIP metalloprotease RseP [Helicobacter pametensis]
MSLLAALIALSFLIFFHELGHFLAARFFGVKVEVFSIGFGKKIIKKTYGDTEYALSWIPLGGYVKMKGQSDSDPLSQNQDPDSYTSKSPLQRIVILLAGPLFNILLALLIYVGMAYGDREVLLPSIGEVQTGMPAQSAGIMAGDRVLRINGVEVKSWFDMAEKVMEAQGRLTLMIQRGDENLEVGVIPKMIERENVFGEKVSVSVIGIRPSGEIGVMHYGVWDALRLGASQTLSSSTLIIQGVQKLISGVVPTSEVGGVISIVQVMDKAQESGLVQFLALVALISINLGILNLLPIPALDGGHILFNLYELVTKRTPSESVLYYLTLMGWAILFALMFLGLYNDINRIVGG